MEVLIVIGLIIIIVLLTNIRSQQIASEERNHQKFLSLKKELLEIKEKGLPNVINEAPARPEEPAVVQWRPYTAPPILTPDLEQYSEEVPVVPEQQQEITETAPAAAIEEEKIETVPLLQLKTSEPEQAGWWDKWMQKNPDLEKFIGENLVNKIGIAVLVLGIAFFVKYAIDQNWIKETGRVCIGIGCGIILIGIAHYLRNSYRSFSSVLAGGGIAVFYFTIAFAFHEYNLFSQTEAFVIMIVITAFAVAISLLYNKIELAVIAIIGGFLTPFLVSTGEGNYVVLFSYLLILNIGMLAIAYFKKWQLLNVIALFFTLIIFSGWLIQNTSFSNTSLPYKNAMLFASAFYLVFLCAALIHNLRKQRAFSAFDFSLLMIITFSYYAQGMTILSEWNSGEFQGMFTIILGIINLSLAWFLYKSKKGDRNLLYLLIGLTLTFISLAAPVQLHGHSITMFWCAEAVLLYWLHQRSGIIIFKFSSAIILVLMFGSLLMDWSIANESANFIPLIFKGWQGIITNIMALLSFSFYAFLVKKEPEGNTYIFGFKNSIVTTVLMTLAASVLYLTCIFAVNLYFSGERSFNIPNAYHQLVTYLLLAGTLLVLPRMKITEKPILPVALILAGFGFYFFSTLNSNNLITGVIENKYPGRHAFIHWLSDSCLLYLLYNLIAIFRKNSAYLGNLFTWLISLLLVVFFSIECGLLYVSLLSSAVTIETFTAQYSKAGLTIIWAVFSFTLMWLGMKHKYKTLRIISLSIFSAALLKLFVFDIINISEGGKIAAFIMLGVLLLVISFMYQRLKKLIIDNEEKTM